MNSRSERLSILSFPFGSYITTLSSDRVVFPKYPESAGSQPKNMLQQSFGLNADATVDRVMEIARELAEYIAEIVWEQGEEDTRTVIDELY